MEDAFEGRMEFLDKAKQPPDILFISDVGLENCDVRAERRKCLADILEIRIFLPAPSYQDEVFDVALCYQPFGDFDPKRTKPSGDEIGSLEIGRSYRSLGSDCTNHACHESSALP